MKMVWRTDRCGELSKSDVGKEVTLAGWVSSRRDHGKLIFIDIREQSGIVQLVFNSREFPEVFQKASSLSKEDVISVQGKVSERPKGTINPNLPTGEIEISVQEIKILNPSRPLPFEIMEKADVEENTRLTYRYLDLRRPSLLKNLLIRDKSSFLIRKFLKDEGFIEVETPILAKSTPEGARDFLVPSRLSPGKFYALPQSPQLFKQILMVSGIDRYFQFARCLRDEDLRADRQLEHTQIDMELSFTEREEIFSLIEKMMAILFKEIKGIELSLPFPRLTYQESISKYGTDKPDIKASGHCEPKGRGNPSFLWIIDPPLFEYNEEEKRIQPLHHPFVLPHCSGSSSALDCSGRARSALEKEPLKVKGEAYDLVCNGEEIGGGSMRIYQRELQEKIFKIIGLSQKEYKEKFGFLLNSFDYGAPPHGGIALGFDRLLTILCDVDNIREVIAFPKTQKGVCPLTGAPGEVSEKQLKELSIKTEVRKQVV